MKKRSVFVTGSDGMLGCDLVIAIERSQSWKCIPSTLETMDITDAAQVRKTLNTYKPNALIHCASYTNVNKAESNRDFAFTVNSDGTRNVAEVCGEMEIPLIYLSTDYVFDSKKTTPYLETDTPNPINVYGASKLKGDSGGRNPFQAIFENFSGFRKSLIRKDLKNTPKPEIHLFLPWAKSGFFEKIKT